MLVELAVSRRQVPQLVDRVHGDWQEVVEIVVDWPAEWSPRPGTLEHVAFHQQQVDLIALPVQRPSVIGAVREQRVDVTAAHNHPSGLRN